MGGGHSQNAGPELAIASIYAPSFENAPIPGLYLAHQIQQLGVHIKSCDMVINPFKDI
jgi:hypothetical protein